ncbi:hypothetical protein EMCRGX_G004530 [Ephydatia muelleri]
MVADLWITIRGFSCLRSSLDQLRIDLNKLKQDFEEFVVSNFSIDYSVYKVFAQKPCEAYAKFTTSEFVEKFVPLLKADVDRVPMYLHHVAMLVEENWGARTFFVDVQQIDVADGSIVQERD